uniref:Uncharacterized protein n=1 Tax=Trichogramma kaykai TaxID=54128 RepID=A0ABD2WAB3_9HYME
MLICRPFFPSISPSLISTRNLDDKFLAISGRERHINCIESAWLTTEVSFARVVSGSRARGCDAYEDDGLVTSLT